MQLLAAQNHSGGQKSRLALARAVFADADIVLLDGNPLKDLQALEQVVRVIQAGHVVTTHP